MGTTNLGSLELADNLTVTGTQTIAGNVTYAGDVTLGDATTDTTTVSGILVANAQVIPASTETIAAGGTTTALDLTKFHHDIDADAGGDIFTLADGAQGQIVVCVMKSATGTATVTPTTFLGGTSVTFDAAGDSVMLRFQDTLGWSIIGGNSYTVI